MIRNILSNNFLHTLLDTHHVFQLHRTPDPQIAEISFWDRVLYKQFSFREQFRDSLEQYKAKRTDISPHTGLVTHIQKLYVLIIIDSEIKPFRSVIDFGANHLVRKIKIKTVINIQKWAPDREFFRNIIIFATYL